MRAATVVQGPGRCRRSQRTAGTPSYCWGNGLADRRHPRSRLPSQCSATESWMATAIDPWRRRTKTVAALISIFVVATTKCCLLRRDADTKLFRHGQIIGTGTVLSAPTPPQTKTQKIAVLPQKSRTQLHIATY